jgi:hypothetical protein
MSAGNSPPDTGGVAAPSIIKMRSFRSGADGVVGIRKCFRMRSLKEVPFRRLRASKRLRSAPDHPVRSIKGGFATSLLMSRPPLLYQEGNGAPKFIHTFILLYKMLLHEFCKALLEEEGKNRLKGVKLSPRSTRWKQRGLKPATDFRPLTSLRRLSYRRLASRLSHLPDSIRLSRRNRQQ